MSENGRPDPATEAFSAHRNLLFSPALIMRLDEELDSVTALQVEGGLITGIYVVRNPEKLSRMDQENPLHR